MSAQSENQAPVIIKKYANRRLYNTETSSYITLEHLAAMVKDNREFKVLDAKSGDDITRSVLTQIIVEEESRGQTMLPVNFLRHLISLYGDGLQSMVPQYLEASMEQFRRNQEQFRKAMQGAFGGGAFGAAPFGPFQELAKQNMAMIEAATGMFNPLQQAGKAPAGTPAADASSADDIKELRAQMAMLQQKLEKLAEK
jgi:polyhydroxyalkanoate synthesis repressor PhaR